ncbi:Transmembrane protein 135 [Populus alba x Populus x berolinensis]|nr:Transmembrane protein 135 [Populus alba x Populus x berolinensis]
MTLSPPLGSNMRSRYPIGHSFASPHLTSHNSAQTDGMFHHYQQIHTGTCLAVSKHIWSVFKQQALQHIWEGSSWYCKIKLVSICVLFICLDVDVSALQNFQLPTGLALAIEKKSRRIEISLYCFARAVESFFICARDAGYLPESMNLKRADVVIFSISTAIIMHCYEQEREVFRSKYLNVLDWVFGVPRPPGDTSPRKDGLKAS